MYPLYTVDNLVSIDLVVRARVCKPVLGDLPVEMSRRQDGCWKLRVVGTVRPVLRFEAEAGAGPIVTPAESGRTIGDAIALVEVQPRLRRPDLHRQVCGSNACGEGRG